MRRNKRKLIDSERFQSIAKFFKVSKEESETTKKTGQSNDGQKDDEKDKQSVSSGEGSSSQPSLTYSQDRAVYDGIDQQVTSSSECSLLIQTQSKQHPHNLETSSVSEEDTLSPKPYKSVADLEKTMIPVAEATPPVAKQDASVDSLIKSGSDDVSGITNPDKRTDNKARIQSPLFSQSTWLLELREKLSQAPIISAKRTDPDNRSTDSSECVTPKKTEKKTSAQKSPLLVSKSKLFELKEKLIQSQEIQARIRPQGGSTPPSREMCGNSDNCGAKNLSEQEQWGKSSKVKMVHEKSILELINSNASSKGVSEWLETSDQDTLTDNLSSDMIDVNDDDPTEMDLTMTSQNSSPHRNEPTNSQEAISPELKANTETDEDALLGSDGGSDSCSVSSSILGSDITRGRNNRRHRPNVIDTEDSDEDALSKSFGISDSDDDEDLIAIDKILRVSREASTRAVPRTPDRLSQSILDDSLNFSSQETVYRATVSGDNLSCKSFLNGLITEVKVKEKIITDYQQLHAELRNDILRGGIVRVDEENNVDGDANDLNPEQKRQLDEMMIRESEIKKVNPGLEIFSSAHYKRLFNENISPGNCGFVPGHSHMDILIAKLTPEKYDYFITSDILDLSYKNVSDMDSIFRWFLFLMSIHSNTQITNTCKRCIEEIIFKQSYVYNVSKTWSPTVNDILRVLLNFGGDPCQLVPDMSLVDSTVIRNLLVPLGDENAENQQAADNALNRYNRENFRMVLQTITFTLNYRPKYTATDLTALIVIILRSALDKSLTLFWLASDFQLCIAAALDCYQECDWLPQVEIICNVLSTHTEHHHDRLRLAELVPPGPRGSFLQTRLSYCMLLKILDEPGTCSSLEKYQIKHLEVLIPSLRTMIVENQFYLLHNVVLLLDLAVADENAKQHDKGSLTILTDSMRKLASLIKEDLRFLDRSKVKDGIVRLTSKWSLMMLKMGSKQMSLYSWTRQSPHKVQVERVKASQTDKESDESDAEDVDVEDCTDFMDVDPPPKDDEQSPSSSLPCTTSGVLSNRNENTPTDLPNIFEYIKVKIEKPWDDSERTPTKRPTFQNSYNISSTLKKLSSSQKKEVDIISVSDDSDDSLPEI